MIILIFPRLTIKQLGITYAYKCLVTIILSLNLFGNVRYKFRKRKPLLSYLKWHIKYMLEEFTENKF